jgi:hypothetical protein
MTLQVPELQKGIPKDLNIGPQALTMRKISKTTKPKNLASMRSSRASDGLSALCQLIASWRTPSLLRHPASTTMAVRSNTQSINQSINQTINPEAPPPPRPAAATLPPLHRRWHSFSTPPHLSYADTPICPVPNPDVAPAPYYLPNCFYPSSRSSFATLLPAHRSNAVDAMLMSLLLFFLLLHQRRCVATGADHPGIRGEHSCGSMTNALLCSAPLRSAMQASPQGPCPASPPTACRAFLPILPPTLCWSLWVPAPQARSHVPTCASSQRSHHLGLELELLSTLLCTSCFPSLLC